MTYSAASSKILSIRRWYSKRASSSTGLAAGGWTLCLFWGGCVDEKMMRARVSGVGLFSLVDRPHIDPAAPVCLWRPVAVALPRPSPPPSSFKGTRLGDSLH